MPDVVGAQIHNATEDISLLVLRGSKLYISDGDNTKAKLVTDNYKLGTKVDMKWVVSGGMTRAYINGSLQLTIDRAYDGAYFKAGAYPQANCDNSSPCSSTNYGSTTITKLTVSHSGLTSTLNRMLAPATETMGIVGYVRELEVAVVKALAASERMLAGARAEAQASGPSAVAALDRVGLAVREARVLLKAGEPIAEVTFHFQREVDAAARQLVEADVRKLREDLAAIEALPMAPDQQLGAVVVDEAGRQRLSQRDWSPLGALESIKALVTALDVDRSDEAQPVMPMATISVTEDMATAMRLHALGWHTVYHHEILAAGLAPEDPGTVLHQRLRWSQGTLQVMLKENPLRQKGMTIGQRLMYFATMWSYLSGFTAVVYLLAPMLYLFFGIQPVRSYGAGFILHIAPYLIATQMLFFVVGYGIRTWRPAVQPRAVPDLDPRGDHGGGQRVLRSQPGVVVTPKTRQDGDGGFPWRLIRPQLVTIALLVLAVIVGLVRLSLGLAPTAEGTWVNIAWVVYDLVVLSVIIEAARYRGSNVPPAGSAASPAREG